MNELFVPPLAALNPPADLLEGLAESAWLSEAVQARLDHRDPWQNAVAAGLIARYATSPTFLEKFFRGEVEEAVARPRRWARAWSEDEARTVVHLAQAEVDMLLLDIQKLSETIAPDDGQWVSNLVELCQRRDALEGVRILLAECGQARDIEDMLQILDEENRLFVISLPVVVELHDKWLAAVRELALSTGSDCWWTVLVATAEEGSGIWLDDEESRGEAAETFSDRVPGPDCPRCGFEFCRCKELGLDPAWCTGCNRDTAFCRCHPLEDKG